MIRIPSDLADLRIDGIEEDVVTLEIKMVYLELIWRCHK